MSPLHAVLNSGQVNGAMSGNLVSKFRNFHEDFAATKHDQIVDL
jgi:hypothetical protein